MIWIWLALETAVMLCWVPNFDKYYGEEFIIRHDDQGTMLAVRKNTFDYFTPELKECLSEDR